MQENLLSYQIEQVIALAQTQIGKPYLRGGKDEAGFDCSGLWCWVFSERGIRFSSRFTAAMFAQTCKKKSITEVQRGDFFFWEQEPDQDVQHRRIYHIEMVMEKPFWEDGMRKVKTLGSSKTGVRFDLLGEEIDGEGVGLRIREVNAYRFFAEVPYYMILTSFAQGASEKILKVSADRVPLVAK